MAAALSQTEFVTMRASVIAEGGKMDDFIVKYREATGSEATDTSLQSALSNRTSLIRNALIERGVSAEKAKELIPNFPRQTSTKANLDAAVDLILAGASVDEANGEDE